MIPLIALLSILSPGAISKAGIEVNAETIGGRWAIKGAVDGKPIYFLLCSSVGNTDVSGQLTGLPPNDIPSPHTIEIGGVRFKDVPIGVRNAGAVATGSNDEHVAAGVLGDNFLQHMQIGLDVLARKWTLWPDSHLSNDEARDWVAKFVPWPHISGESKVDELAIQRTPDGYACDVSMGSHATQALIDLSVDSFYFPSAKLGPWHAVQLGQIDTDAGESFTLDAVPGFQIGSTKSWAVGAHEPGLVLGDNEDSMRLGVRGLRTTRFLLDFDGGKLYRSAPSADVCTSMVLTDVVGIPLTLVDGNLFVGPDAYHLTSAITKAIDGLKVVDISGYSPASLAKDLREADSAALKVFGALVTSDYKVHVDAGGEKTREVSYHRTGF